MATLKKNNKILQFKIQIEDITKPPVWRRLSMPAFATFYDLHIAIQISFGWGDYHLFQFSPKPLSSDLCIKIPDDYDSEYGILELRDAEKTDLTSIFKRKGKKFTYLYDFGDFWVHNIILEEITDGSSNSPICLTGKGKCPPEDCGGVWGYTNMKKSLEDKDHPEHFEFIEWLDLNKGEDWNPKEFDLKHTQALLANAFK